jgi:hypothetical protein
MSQENKKARHLQNCKIAPDSIPECSVLVAYGSLNVPSRKRKEEAKQTLYLNRI